MLCNKGSPLRQRQWRVVCIATKSFFFSSRRRHTRLVSDWSSDVCSSDLVAVAVTAANRLRHLLQRQPVVIQLSQHSPPQWKSRLPASWTAAQFLVSPSNPPPKSPALA